MTLETDTLVQASTIYWQTCDFVNTGVSVGTMSVFKKIRGL